MDQQNENTIGVLIALTKITLIIIEQNTIITGEVEMIH
jgi:hypothetical protein